MSRRRITDQLDDAVEDALRARAVMPEAQRILLQQLPTAGAQSYDVAHAGATAWCDHHERTIAACRKAYLEGRSDRICMGVSLPRATDPTGDAAVADRIFEGLREVQARAARMAADAEWIRSWVEGQIVEDATPETTERLAAINDSPKCQHHLRYGYLVDVPRGTKPTRVRFRGQHILAAEYLLCRWCKDDIRNRYEQTGERRLTHEHELSRAQRKLGWPLLVA